MQVLLALALIIGANLARQEDETEKSIRAICASVEGARIYSSAYYVPEAGDVVGMELAVFPDSARPALLFLYEGTPFAYPVIPMKGPTKGPKVRLTGRAIADLV